MSRQTGVIQPLPDPDHAPKCLACGAPTALLARLDERRYYVFQCTACGKARKMYPSDVATAKARGL